MKIEHLPSTATAEQVAEIIKRDGAVIVDELASHATMDKAIAELRPWIDATPFGVDQFSGRNTKRTGALIARSETCRDFVAHPLVLDTVKQVLGHATSFQLHLTQVIAIGPGEPAQEVHRDQWAFDYYPFASDYEVQCNTIWAMTDFTEENGATRIIPKSNHFEDKLKFKFADTIPAEMKKGSVLFYSGRAYHAGGANQSDETRMGCNITYCVSWLRQEENQYLSVPQEIAKTLPVKLLRLMGYRRGSYALGYIDDIRDPIKVLLPEYEGASKGDEYEQSRDRGLS